MKDQDKTKEELINELMGNRQRIAELEESLVTIKQQQAPRALGPITDTTGRRVAEEALRHRGPLFSSVLDALPHPFYVINPSDYIIEIANSAAVASGRRTGAACYSAHNRDQPCGGTDYPCPINEVKKTKQAVTAEHIHYKEDGSWTHVEVHACPLLDSEGNVKQVIKYCLDITDKKHAEEALAESEERLELALAGADLGLWDYNLQTGETFISQRRAEMLGYSLDEIEPHISSWGRLVHLDDVERVVEAFNAHARGETPLYQCEHRLRHKSGEYIWVLARAKIVKRDTRGNPVRLIGTSLDITDRKQADEALRKAHDELELKVWERTAQLKTMNEDLLREIERRKRVEEALRESEKKYRSVFDNAAVGINLKRPDGTFSEVNQALVEILGYDRDELSRLSFLDITHPDDVQLSREMHTALERGDIHTYRTEKRYIGKGGRTIWVDTSVKALRDSLGQLRATVGIIADITERKNADVALRRSEEFNRRLVHHAPFGIAYVARDGTIEYVNPATNRIMGVPEDQISPVLGRIIHELPGLQDRSGIQESRRRFTKGEPFSDLEVPYKSSMGRDTVLLVAATPRFGSDGTVAGGIVMFMDISERKKIEELQRQTARYRAVADLTGGVSHNFNNLLHIVIGYVELALMDLDAGDYVMVKENLEKVLDSSRFGAETVRRLQRFAQQGAAVRASETEVFDLSDLAAQAVEVSQAWLTAGEKEGRKVSLHTRLKEGCFVSADKNEIFTVVVNLLRNAVEALPRGGDIDLTTAVEADKVVLQVRDAGIGISQENLGRLFNPFFTTKAEPGAGLSLASGRRTVEDFGRQILVDSVEGHGTTFTVLLPLAEKLPEPARALPERDTEKRLTILVIDDMEAITDLMRSALTSYGHSVLTALSGEAGIEIFKENPADVVICDLGMPGMNGWEVGKRVSAVCQERGVPKTPFILLTAWSGQELEKEQVARSGVDAVVGKPLNIQNLLEVVRVAVEESLSKYLDRGPKK